MKIHTLEIEGALIHRVKGKVRGVVCTVKGRDEVVVLEGSGILGLLGKGGAWAEPEILAPVMGAAEDDVIKSADGLTEDGFKCTQCGRWFQKKQGLATHRAKAHKTK